MLRILRPVVVCLLAFVPSVVLGAMQYWVSVGSFKDQDSAQRSGADASRKLDAPASVIPVQTPNGLYFRVAIGPHSDRAAADERIRTAQAAGFSGAWMWSGDASVFVDARSGLAPDAGQRGLTGDEMAYEAIDPGALNPGALNSGASKEQGVASVGETVDEMDAYEATFDTSYDESIEALLNDSDYLDGDYLDDLPGIRTQERVPVESEDIPELVEEAPTGYRLNKLRRDASLTAPPKLQNFEQDSDPPTLQTPRPARTPSGAANPIPLASYDESNLSIRIDGKLDEAPWREIVGVDSFLVVDPDTETTPVYETVVKMFYTDRGLYAAFEMEQPPDTLVRRYSGRDQRWVNRDNVSVTLDTSGQGRYGYWFNLALGGNQSDGTVLPERQFSGDWDGAWSGSTAETERGWNAEIFLPWSQVAMPKESGQRIINAYASRKVAHLDERWAVPSLPFTQPLFMSALQPLSLREVDPRQQWSVFPYLSATRDELEAVTEPRAGADFFWRPSTNFQMTATLNPDFGNVESDDVIVNLGAFETFFPEKRLFFQEGTEVFDATPRATRGDRVTALHTRRIGGRGRAPMVPDGVTVPARELGQPIELQGAVKVVGQAGDVRYGILGAVEDDAKFDVGQINYYQDGSDYGIARFLYENTGDDNSYRALGTISTLATHPDQDASVHGLDYHYLSGRGRIKIDGQFLYSDKDEVGQGGGGFVDLRYTQRQGLNVGLGISHFDEHLDLNDLGFLRRNDVTRYNASVRYSRSNLDSVRKASLDTWTDYAVNGDGRRTASGLGTRLDLDLKNRDSLRLGLNYSGRRFYDRASRGNGTFSVEPSSSMSARYRSDSAKRLSYHVELGRSDEALDGVAQSGRIGVNWRPVDEISLGANARYRKRDAWLLWQGDRDFTTFETEEWRPSLDLDYFLSAKQQLRLSAQWVAIKALEQDNYIVPSRVGDLIEVAPDTESDDFAISRLNVQLRYRWELAPLSELFVVYTLNGESDRRLMAFDDLVQEAYDNPIGEQLVVKLRYRLGS